MTPLPSAASISLRRVYVDRPGMHGWHGFVVVRTPRGRNARLLHLSTLHEVKLKASELERAQPLPDAPAAIAKGIRKRMAKLAGKKFARSLAEAILERIAAATTPKRPWSRPKISVVPVQVELFDEVRP